MAKLPFIRTTPYLYAGSEKAEEVFPRAQPKVLFYRVVGDYLGAESRNHARRLEQDLGS